MNLQFTYEVKKEFDNLQRGGGKYNPKHQPALVSEMLIAGINMESEGQVVRFIEKKIQAEQIDPLMATAFLQLQWDTIEDETTKRLDELFDTHDPFEDITAYLTLNSRCSYNTRAKYFFVSLGGSRPMGVTIHELMHFYAHTFIEPLFEQQGSLAEFGNIKEALTVLLNSVFFDLIEGEDNGYEMHADLRSWIQANWKAGMSVQTLTRNYFTRS